MAVHDMSLPTSRCGCKPPNSDTDVDANTNADVDINTNADDAIPNKPEKKGQKIQLSPCPVWASKT